ncbi:DUF2493 domain-containing protein [Mycobacterium sp. CnD-18-1]|uniref:DUF2493 domain-containing protein n=1 Tax=Mycobacterium sp. CnD-18-1 TaxID=2917744 RepID=UPI001EF1F7B7|nr:DUF2493 domain-containing protein [Mycobacterium sp. CnD-18-1]MCG7607140.1 DUF2493 domain-containing protein [Mycobacterium sp. CnD-18-1]
MTVHLHNCEWVESPEVTRQLDWIRLCACGFSPDRPAWRVIVTGSRSHSDKTLVWMKLGDELRHAEFLGVPLVVVEGQCPHGGADKFAEDYVRVATVEGHDVWHDPFPANWKALGKRAGPYRNQQMVDAGADVCLAFPTAESRGTYDCIRRAEEAGIHVKVFE